MGTAIPPEPAAPAPGTPEFQRLLEAARAAEEARLGHPIDGFLDLPGYDRAIPRGGPGAG